MKYFAAVTNILTAGALMAIAGSATAQQSYPSKPIRFIVPYAPGGGTTPLAHLIGQKLTESWGQPVIVDNRPGGNTMIGSEALVKSPPDGYTIMLAGTTHVIVPLLNSAPYDAVKDFAPVATMVATEYLLVVHPSVPANTLQQLIALAKAKPGQLNYASAGNGTTNHLAGELINIMAGVKIQHIPYKGGGPALADLIGGQVQMFINNPYSLISPIKSGKIKAIAITGENRLAALPEVPTFAEAGLPGINLKTWQGILAPAATPKNIVNRLSSEIAKILALADVKEKVARQGLEPFPSTPEQFAALIKTDMERFATIIKAANIKFEN